MGFADSLKSFRSQSYGDKKHSEQKPEMENSRIIKLTDEEKKTFEGSKPGEDLVCEVHGSLESDGHFHVMSVSPPGGAESYGEDEKEMAGQVAQKVMPTVQPSPS